MPDNEYQNPLWAAFEYGILRPIGAQIYASFNPLPDAPWMHGAASNYIYNASKYNAYQIQFRDAELGRRTNALLKNAEKYGVADWLKHNQWAIQMILKADTPGMREQIRNSMPPSIADALLRSFDALTANEPGMDRIYAGLANTYGSAKGNEMAAYAANYASNMIRQQKANSLGLRRVDAGSMGAWLQWQQSTGYNFEVAAGLNGDDIKSYNTLFENTFNADHNKGARTAATRSYLETQIANSSNKEDIRILEQMKKNLDEGKDLYADLDLEGTDYDDREAVKEHFGLDKNIATYAQANQGIIYESAINKELSKPDSRLRSQFDQFVLANNNNVALKDIKDDAERARKETDLRNQFIHRLQQDALKPIEDREYDVNGTELESLINQREETETALGAQGFRAQREFERQEINTHEMQALGQAVWDKLSPEEQEQYKKTYGGTSAAQLYLGVEYASKYAGWNMNHLDFVGAAGASQYLAAAADLAGLSKDALSQQVAFIGSTIKRKGLTTVAAQAATTWQATAKAQGIQMSQEQRLEVAQRTTRLVDSMEGNNLAMFMQQTFDPESSLGKLQQALRDGTMTPEQEKQFQEYLKNQGKFISDIAAATGKDRGTLVEEARYAEGNWNMMGDTARNNVLGYFDKNVMNIRYQHLASEGAIERAFGRMSDADKQLMGIGQNGVTEKSFQKMVYDVVQSGGANVVEMVSGRLTEGKIKKLRELGLNDAADYAEARAEERARLVKQFKDKGMSEDEAADEADKLLGANRAYNGMSSITHDPNAPFRQGYDMIDPSKKDQKSVEGDENISTVNKAGWWGRKNANEGGTEDSAANLSPEQQALRDKNAAGAKEFNDQIVEYAKTFVQAIIDAFAGAGLGGEVTGAEGGKKPGGWLNSLVSSVVNNTQLMDNVMGVFDKAGERIGDAAVGKINEVTG